MIAPCQSFKVGTIRPHDLDIVHIVVCINHILIEIHVVGEAMLSDSFAHLQEHFVLLGRAKLLIRTNVEVVARDTLGRVVLLFAFLSAILGIVNEVVIDITDTNDRFTLNVSKDSALRGFSMGDLQSPKAKPSPLCASKKESAATR